MIQNNKEQQKTKKTKNQKTKKTIIYLQYI